MKDEGKQMLATNYNEIMKKKLDQIFDLCEEKNIIVESVKITNTSVDSYEKTGNNLDTENDLRVDISVIM